MDLIVNCSDRWTLATAFRLVSVSTKDLLIQLRRQSLFIHSVECGYDPGNSCLFSLSEKVSCYNTDLARIQSTRNRLTDWHRLPLGRWEMFFRDHPWENIDISSPKPGHPTLWGVRFRWKIPGVFVGWLVTGSLSLKLACIVLEDD